MLDSTSVPGGELAPYVELPADDLGSLAHSVQTKVAVATAFSEHLGCETFPSSRTRSRRSRLS